jgi:membrane associated rhomboid family serine protease
MKDFGYLVLLLGFIEIADRAFFDNTLETHGIHPRSFAHWEGLLFAPFLHDGWGHLLSNSISLLILGSVILAWGWRELAIVSAVSALTAGILVWLIGTSGTNHIGASSVVFGYLGFLLASGFYRRTPITIIISILVVIFYGSAIMGILPTENIRNANISWEAHLGGALGGIFVARSRRLQMASHSDFSTR